MSPRAAGVFVLLPAFQFAAMFVVQRRAAGGATDWRASFIEAAVIFGLIVTGLTEVLSLGHWITREHLAASWSVSIVLTVAMALRPAPTSHRVTHVWRMDERLLVLATATILVTVGVTAICAPPNTWDSMTYHMSRVMHWVQNRSVMFYPTHILRQLYFGPWSEYVVLHLQVLSGTDRFANLVQWFSMAGSALVVSLVTSQLGGSRRAQLFAAFVTATIPMGILQGSSTQTDYVLGFWLLCATSVTLSAHARKWPSAVVVGGCVGLAVLTKGTTYVLFAPFGVWLAVSLLAGRQIRRAAIAVGLAVVINLGMFARNMSLFSAPVAPVGAEAAVLRNQTVTPAVILSNLVRNATIHLGTIPAVDAKLEALVDRLHEELNLSPNDPATTYPDTVYHVLPLSLHEDDAGDNLHFILAIGCLLLYAVGRRRSRTRTIYVLATMASAVLFCAVLRWQPWNSRLQLPWFLLMAPVCALVVSETSSRLATVVAFVLFAGAVPYATRNDARQLVSRNGAMFEARTDQYFENRPSLRAPFAALGELAARASCRHVGLILGVDGWEYPVWTTVRAYVEAPVWIRHVNVTNASRELPTEWDAAPCLVVSDADQGEAVTVEGRAYGAIRPGPRLWVYEPNATDSRGARPEGSAR